MSSRPFLAVLAVVGLVATLCAAPAPTAAEAEQLRVIQSKTPEERARIDRLPVLIAAGTSSGRIEERIVTLNRDLVTVQG